MAIATSVMKDHKLHFASLLQGRGGRIVGTRRLGEALHAQAPAEGAVPGLIRRQLHRS